MSSRSLAVFNSMEKLKTFMNAFYDILNKKRNKQNKRKTDKFMLRFNCVKNTF